MSNQTILASPMPLWQLDTTLGAGAVVSQELNLRRFLNGRIRGSVESDVAKSTFYIQQGLSRVDLPGLSWDVPQDAAIVGPNLHYPFDVIVIQPYVKLEFTNGAAPATLFRVFVEALPI